MKKYFPLAIGIPALFSFGELVAACTSSSMIPEPSFGSDAGASDATTFSDGVPINGDPIVSPASPGASVTIHFPTAGTYGYWCMVHQTMMMGAIQVQ